MSMNDSRKLIPLLNNRQIRNNNGRPKSRPQYFWFILPSFVNNAAAVSASDRRQIGHDDACNTGQIAPGAHTRLHEWIQSGLIDCRNNSGGGKPNSSVTPNEDPAHCDRTGYQSCYNIGFNNGRSQPNTTCPTDIPHTRNYCIGWLNGARSAGASPAQQQKDAQSTGCVNVRSCIINQSSQQRQFGATP